MGAPNPQSNEMVRSRRREQRSMGEPLDTDSRKVQNYGGCLYINPTDYGIKTLDIEKGDSLQVETYPDRIVLTRRDD